jgi:hypothetical protein
MLTYAFTAWLVLNGQLHVEILDSGLSEQRCWALQDTIVQVDPALLGLHTEAPILPYECIPEWEV